MQIFSKYLKRIFLYLIPLIVFTNQLEPKCIDNSTYNETNKIYDEINKICQQENSSCPMGKAIIQIFKTVSLISNTHEKKVNNNSTLSYQNARNSNISCKNIIYLSNEVENYVFNFSNCTINVTGTLEIQEDDNVLSFKHYLSEFDMDFITFNLSKDNNNKKIMDILYEFPDNLEDTFRYDCKNYNVNRIYSEESKEIMINISTLYADKMYNLTRMINDIEKQENILQGIINQYKSKTSILKEDKEYSNYITYVAFNEFNYNSSIFCPEAIFLINLKVDFEYALNYNITYNEGFITFDYIYGIMNSKKTKEDTPHYVGNKIDHSADFDKILSPKEREYIWSTIKDEFLKLLKEIIPVT